MVYLSEGGQKTFDRTVEPVFSGEGFAHLNEGETLSDQGFDDLFERLGHGLPFGLNHYHYQNQLTRTRI